MVPIEQTLREEIAVSLEVYKVDSFIHLQKAAENGSLETIVKIKSSIPGARIKDIIPVEKKQEPTPKQG